MEHIVLLSAFILSLAGSVLLLLDFKVRQQATARLAHAEAIERRILDGNSVDVMRGSFLVAGVECVVTAISRNGFGPDDAFLVTGQDKASLERAHRIAMLVNQ